MSSSWKNSVLIVEDDRQTSLMLKTVLTQAGYQVRTVEDGSKCFDAIRDEVPDVVLLDLNLPHESGLSILKKLKNIGSTHNIKVIIVTADHEPETVREALKRHADDFVIKPFETEDLLNRIGRFSVQWNLKTAREVSELVAEQPKEVSPLPEVSSEHWRAFSLLYQGIEVSVIIPKHLEPSALLKFTDADLKSKFGVFIKNNNQTWKKVWGALTSLKSAA